MQSNSSPRSRHQKQDNNTSGATTQKYQPKQQNNNVNKSQQDNAPTSAQANSNNNNNNKSSFSSGPNKSNNFTSAGKYVPPALRKQSMPQNEQFQTQQNGTVPSAAAPAASQVNAPKYTIRDLSAPQNNNSNTATASVTTTSLAPISTGPTPAAVSSTHIENSQIERIQPRQFQNNRPPQNAHTHAPATSTQPPVSAAAPVQQSNGAYVPPMANNDRFQRPQTSFYGESNSRGAGGYSDYRQGDFSRQAPSAGGYNSRPQTGGFQGGFGSGQQRYGGGGNQRFDRGGGQFKRPPFPMPRNSQKEYDLFGDPAEHSSKEVSTTAIDFKNYQDIPVDASGLDVPAPFELFADIPLHEVIKLNIELSGYTSATPVQKHAIAIGLAQRDLMACAQTGSGKTAAFLIPTVSNIIQQNLHMHPNSGPDATGRFTTFPCALVLAPTRELATQIYNESRKFTYRTNLRCVVIYGGADQRGQFQQIRQGCDIIVATPGRLLDFLERGTISLSMIRTLILDEADRMLDMGFEPQIRQIVYNFDMTSEQRLTWMFSATFPKEIQRLAGDFLQNYIFLAVGRVGSTTDFITQKLEYVSSSYVNDGEKLDKLNRVLAEAEGLTVIFVEKKKSADYLENILLREGINAASIHGDKTQYEREAALGAFKSGQCPVLVATSVAARGLDIPDVRLVVNYEMPSNIDDYVHRIGRTGRAGKKGTSIAFITDDNVRGKGGSSGVLKELHDLLKENHQECPDWFTQIVQSQFRGGGYGNSGGYRGGSNSRGRGGSKFASRDYRQDGQQQQNRGFQQQQYGGASAGYQPPSQSGGSYRAPTAAPARGGFGNSQANMTSQGYQPQQSSGFSQYRGSKSNDAW